MTKKQIAKKIADELGLTQQLVLTIIQRTFDGIIETLVREGRLELRNFGIFEVKKRRPRRAHVPRTGVFVSLPQRFVVTIRPGREMEKRVGRLKELPEGN